MSLVTVARLSAVVISAVTLTFLFVYGLWRADNLFLVPDLIMCALLAAAASAPASRAVPALTVAFAVATGVLMTSVSSYAVRGEFGLASLLGALVCLAVLALLARRLGATSPGKALDASV